MIAKFDIDPSSIANLDETDCTPASGKDCAGSTVNNVSSHAGVRQEMRGPLFKNCQFLNSSATESQSLLLFLQTVLLGKHSSCLQGSACAHRLSSCRTEVPYDCDSRAHVRYSTVRFQQLLPVCTANWQFTFKVTLKAQLVHGAQVVHCTALVARAKPGEP